MTTGDVILAVLVVVLGAAGTFLMLPHRHGAARPRRVHAAGALAASLGLLLFLFFWKPARRPFVPGFFFYVFSAAAIIGGVLTVTSRNPIYSALWFASVVICDVRALPAGGCVVPGRGHDHRLCRCDHRHVPVRDHAGPDGRKGALRPGARAPRRRRRSRASCSCGA